MARVWAVLPQARIVGGAVRDFLAGHKVADVDFAVPLAPEVVMARLRAAGIQVVPTGLAHGTVTAVVAGMGFEITTLRRDVETDGRRAVVAFTDEWEVDAARRDFTFNAMSMDRDGLVFDYFGGRGDLAAGVVRFVGDPGVRIAEDFLRIFRYFRFLARYGRGPDEEALAAIVAARTGIRGLSVERVWNEIKRILMADDPRLALRSMAETGVLAMVFGPDVRLDGLERLVGFGAPVDSMLRVASLLTVPVENFARDYRLSGEETGRLNDLSQPTDLRPGIGEAALRRLLAETPADILVARSWLAQDGVDGWDEVRRRIWAMERPVFPLQGRDLVKLGVAEGPRIGVWLGEVRSWWLEGGCVADAETCRQRVEKLLRLDCDADAEFDHAVTRDAEKFGGGDGVAGHEQEQPAADET
jgi:poly(A) polymerase/tRNA nucleotidyltransferase (CCA-adding enzyme)